MVCTRDNFSVKTCSVFTVSQNKRGGGEAVALPPIFEKGRVRNTGLAAQSPVGERRVPDACLGGWLQAVGSPLGTSPRAPWTLWLPPKSLTPPLVLAEGHGQVLLLQRKGGDELFVPPPLHSS